jgi:hypothetical protein
MESSKTKYKHITVWADDRYPDLIFGTYAPMVEINLEVAQQMIEDRLDFCQGEEKFMLIDFTNVKSVTKEARDFMNSRDGGLKGVLGGAFVSNNVVATLFVNLYLKVSNPVIPAKFFTDRNDALKWLLRIRNEKFSNLA